MPFGIDSEVDAEVVGAVEVPQATVSKPPPRQGVINISAAYQGQGLAAPAADQLAMYETRARAVSLFIKVPFFAYLALNPKLPGMIRLGAGLLAAWEAMQIARQSADIEAMLPDIPVA
jgi:hypothetical protein